MHLRKINAVISLASTALLLQHAIYLSVWMLYRCSIPKPSEYVAWMLLGMAVIHALISIDLAISAHADVEKKKCKSYPKLNFSTIVQRASGVLMVLLAVVHLIGASNYYKPKLLHATLHPLFFAVVLAHVAVSTGKALITLGIGNARTVKIVDVIIKLVCAITFVAGAVGFYLCLFVGVAK